MKAKKYIYRLNKNIEVYKAYIKDKKLLNYFKNKIKKEIGGNNYNTNVKGKMSLFDTFIDDKKFSDFINNNFLREKIMNMDLVNILLVYIFRKENLLELK